MAIIEAPLDPGPWTVHAMSSYAASIRREWHGGNKLIAYVEGPGLSNAAKYAKRRAHGLRNAAVIGAAPAMQAALLAAQAALIAGRAHDALVFVERGLEGEMPPAP